MYSIWLFQIRPEPDLVGFKDSNPARARARFGRTCFNTPDETNGVNNAISCYNEAVRFSVSVVMSLFASFWPGNLWNGNGFCIFVWVTLIKIVNTPLDRSAALVLSIIKWMYSSCTGIRQIQLEIWPEPDLAGFPKKMAGFRFAGAGAEIRCNPNKDTYQKGLAA